MRYAHFNQEWEYLVNTADSLMLEKRLAILTIHMGILKLINFFYNNYSSTVTYT